ncbi:Nuclease SbcCD subunit C [Paenibacillus polymyxa E681]|uniref:SbcC/MukB-like Walker B domain-containing protein n=1 Tax=Paenibacillus polymyxa TaxID=1406 RepID=UPI0001E31C5D|nr:SMC family ATPase [Paenibacillus polymyxa]ADM71982.1 hypothetical protein PPE_04202 [Paenibacillus polymyxa E681]QNV59015.1 Nuclease SbcCD subunit C [Paenibacillus polymyxa E681]QNV63841.1 Nuclease SbcCD subunit C [Paenibacillus polymyxa E681]
MKPLKLTMTAFGPFKDKEVIDFSELKGHRLFVVSGNTGAGKTSIFDAICFALYGDASGEDRNDSKMLRSHFADDQVHTAVDFEFELKGRSYRVFRQLAHVKAGNKGATGDRYELYEIDRGKEVPITDRFIVSQVDEKIQKITGLTKEQFKQIVMLPQGEFRKLLTSETENKEEILRRIFNTGLYKYVADHLNEKRKEIQQLCTELVNIRDYHISNVKGSLAVREGSDLYNVFQQQHYNVYQVLEALNKEIDYNAEQMKVMKQELQDENAKYQEHTSAYHQSQSLNEQFNILDQKITAKQELAEQENHIQQKMVQLSLAEQAVYLHVYEKHYSEITEELVRKSKLLEEALSESVQAESDLQMAVLQYKEEESKEELREQIFHELGRLQGYLPTVKEINQKKQRVVQFAAESEKLSEQVTDVQNQLNTLQSERLTNLAQVKKLEEKSVLLPIKTEKLTLLRQQATIIQEYLNLVQKFEMEHQEERGHRVAFEQADHAHSIVENRWVEGQAGLLASHLHDGDSCPVCGSVNHPKKAVATGDIPTKEELELLRIEKSTTERKHLEAMAKIAATQQQIQEKQHQLLEQGFSLKGIRGVFTELVKEGKALAEEETRLKEDNAKLAPLKLELGTLESKLEEVRKHNEHILNLFNDKKTIYATEKALYDQSLAALPEDARRLEQLEERIRETEDTRKKLGSIWKKAQMQYQETNDRNIKAVANREYAESLKKEAIANKDKAHQSYFNKLEQAGFEREEAYKAAKMTDGARAELKQQIESYKTEMLSFTKQIEEMYTALAGKERHDLDALQQRLQEIEKYIDSVRSEYTHNENNYEKGTEFKANILLAESNWQDAEREHQLVKDLYDVVRGENGKKVSFERYLQIEFLEKIIHHANQRLQHMSSGQFYLVRSDRMEKRGKQSGLGFDVYDNYTGQLRDVKTLSGGEKFNASLCLALGMADVIQSYEGGISLETMFIDEGFGSLDEESLNKAIDTLIDLQQSGRMIGVISHVQELKQVIPAILEVKKTREGYSYTNFCVS